MKPVICSDVTGSLPEKRNEWSNLLQKIKVGTILVNKRLHIIVNIVPFFLFIYDYYRKQTKTYDRQAQ